MKKKFSCTCAKYWVAFFLAILIFGMSVSETVKADTTDVLRWSVVDKPGTTGNIIVHPSDISKIAVSVNNVIYAIDTPYSKVYRSKNGGSTWTDITPSAVPLPAINIAVAPDKPQIVALVANGGANVYLSIDGGDNWINTNVPVLSGTIQCITISKGYAQNNVLVWDMAIGTATWGDALTTGQVWCTQIGATVSGWQNQNASVTQTPPAPATNAEVSAIAFSSNYDNFGSDFTILVVASTNGDAGADSNKTFLCLGSRDISAQTTTWNSIINPVVIDPTNGDDATVIRIVSSIALPSDYNAQNPPNRTAFVSYNRRSIPALPNANDVYRYDINNGLIRLINTGGTDISSIALYGTIKTGTAGVASGKLLAGDYAATSWPLIQVRRCLNPFDLSVTWQLATQPPTGPGSAQVAWSSNGTEAYCGTSRIPEYTPPVPEPPPFPDESAFSRSLDNGDNWTQVGLIDTVIRICDIAPAPDSKSLFMATYNPIGLEWVWRSAGEPLGMYWGRVFGLDTGSDRIILRLSPDYESDDTIYAAEVEVGIPTKARQLGVSHDRGNSWVKRYLPMDVVDMVVADSKTAYVALPNGIIRKTSNEGQVWQYPGVTGLTDINMLCLAKNGHLFVGSRDGKVAYSTDSGTSFIEIPEPVSNTASTGDVQVVADSSYISNNTIYAATDIADMGTWRWTIGISTQWELVDRPLTMLGSGEQFCGLAVGEEGTLYALRMEASGPVSGGMNRSLNPNSPQVVQIEWDVINRTLPAGVTFNPNAVLFSHTMPFLRLTGNFIENDLWSFSTDDPNNPIIYLFQDNLCKVGAWINNASQIGCDPASGRNQGFNLVWEQISLSDEYEVHMAKDTEFSLRLPTEPPSNPFYSPPVVTSPVYVINPGQPLECGHAYYWRVRTRHATTGEFIRSPWSKSGEFIIKAGFSVTTPYYGLQLLTPDNGCGCSCSSPVCFSWTPFKETTAYWFELSENNDMSDPIVSTFAAGTTAYKYDGKLKCNTNYFWRVMAIQPAPSDWSATFSFMTQSNDRPTRTTLAVPSSTPLWVWGILAIGTILVICLIVLIIRRS